MLGLVENLLTSARLESGDWAMRNEPVDLAEVTREAAVLLAPLFEQRRQRVEPAAAAGAWVVGDRTQLLQVVLNLLGNANKFAPEGTRVHVAGGRDGAETCLVEDEGRGCPGDEASLFGASAASGAARPHGAGLGCGSCIDGAAGAAGAETRAEAAPFHRAVRRREARHEGRCRRRPSTALVGFALRRRATGGGGVPGEEALLCSSASCGSVILESTCRIDGSRAADG